MFQQSVNSQNPIAVEGDWASENPRVAVPAPIDGFVAGAGGVIIGNFAWIATDGRTVNSFGVGGVAPNGFVHRDQQGLLTAYLQVAGTTIPPGFPVTLMSDADVYDMIVGGSASTFGASCYARYSDGALFIGSAPTGGSVTGSLGSTNTAVLGATMTATGAGTALTVSAVTGTITVGDTLGTTSGITAGTTITAFVSGTAGGAGVYTTSAATTISGATATCFGKTVVVTSTTGLISIGETISGGAGFPVTATVSGQVSGTVGGAGTYTLSAIGTAYTASASGVTTFGNIIDVSAIISGGIYVGDPISGGVPSNSVVTGQVSGSDGQSGVYTINTVGTAYVASTTITVVGGIITRFKAKSAANVGELAVISTWGN